MLVFPLFAVGLGIGGMLGAAVIKNVLFCDGVSLRRSHARKKNWFVELDFV